MMLPADSQMPGSGSRSLTVDGPPPESPRFTWQDKLLALLGVIFCFELGVFLLVFPWVSEWNANYFARMPAWAHDLWVSPYFRGAISGVGLVNVYISFLEVLRLRRFSE